MFDIMGIVVFDCVCLVLLFMVEFSDSFEFSDVVVKVVKVVIVIMFCDFK